MSSIRISLVEYTRVRARANLNLREELPLHEGELLRHRCRFKVQYGLRCRCAISSTTASVVSRLVVGEKRANCTIHDERVSRELEMDMTLYISAEVWLHHQYPRLDNDLRRSKLQPHLDQYNRSVVPLGPRLRRALNTIVSSDTQASVRRASGGAFKPKMGIAR